MGATVRPDKPTPGPRHLVGSTGHEAQPRPGAPGNKHTVTAVATTRSSCPGSPAVAQSPYSVLELLDGSRVPLALGERDDGGRSSSGVTSRRSSSVLLVGHDRP